MLDCFDVAQSLWQSLRSFICLTVCTLAKESFLYNDTKPLFNMLEEVSQRSSVSRGQSFEDFLHVSVCALGHPLMEDEYLKTIEKHKAGSQGKRGVDTLAKMFGTMVATMEKTRQDVLGDLFQGGITYGEKGQFLTPEPICAMMARMNLPSEKTDLDGRRTVNDPCCGSGRMLLAAAQLQPNWQFVGQDVDLRCVRMTAINLALRNHYGHVVHGNSLSNSCDLIYETGRVQVWGNAIRKVGRVPLPDREPEKVDVTPPSIRPTSTGQSTSVSSSSDSQLPAGKQLELF